MATQCLAWTTPFMMFSAMYTICEGPTIDAFKSRSVTSIDCQH